MVIFPLDNCIAISYTVDKETNEPLTKRNRKMMDLDVMCNMYRLPLDGAINPSLWPDYVTAYHLTIAGNVDSILSTGLAAKRCIATHSGEARGEAVYLLAHKNDTRDANVRDFLFDEGAEVAVLEIKIPRSAYQNLHADGLFNMSCECTDGSFPFGVQYTDNIPAEWITRR